MFMSRSALKALFRRRHASCGAPDPACLRTTCLPPRRGRQAHRQAPGAFGVGSDNLPAVDMRSATAWQIIRQARRPAQGGSMPRADVPASSPRAPPRTGNPPGSSLADSGGPAKNPTTTGFLPRETWSNACRFSLVGIERSEIGDLVGGFPPLRGTTDEQRFPSWEWNTLSAFQVGAHRIFAG